MDTATALKKASMAKESAPKEGQPFNLADYFKGVKQEWTKITWAPREQVLAETGVVIVVVALFTILVFGIDKAFQFLISLMTKI